jgi:hypothetical protein
MSIQFAMMGMAVAGGVMQGVMNAQKDAAQSTQLRQQGLMQRIQGSEAELNAAEQEQAMWAKALNLLSTNEADSAHRGVGTDPGTSYSAIMEHNLDVANTTAARMKFLGKSQAGMLDLGASMSDAASAFIGGLQGMDIIMGGLSGLTKAASLGSWGGGGGEKMYGDVSESQMNRFIAGGS